MTDASGEELRFKKPDPASWTGSKRVQQVDNYQKAVGMVDQLLEKDTNIANVIYGDYLRFFLAQAMTAFDDLMNEQVFKEEQYKEFMAQAHTMHYSAENLENPVVVYFG